MFDALAVPITVHCAIPFTECKYPILDLMTEPADQEDVDPALSANFTALMGGRSVATLRAEMAQQGYPIGSGAIQSAKAGWRGLRLETLQKFADFFGCSVADLITPAAERSGWPFGSEISPAEFYALDAVTVKAVTNILVAAAKSQRVMKSLGAPAPAEDSRVAETIKPAPRHELASDFAPLPETQPPKRRLMPAFHPSQLVKKKNEKKGNEGGD